MARYLFHLCNGCQKSTSQRLKGRVDEGTELLACEACGTTNEKRVATVTKKKRTWPYHNESVDVTFESESHEQKYVKANNLDVL